MKKRLSAILLLSLMMLTSGCNMDNIYNDNTQIVQKSDSYAMELSSQTIDGQKMKGTIKKMVGMETIWTYDADEDQEVDITYILNVKKGNVKLVLISPDDTITTVIERSSKADFPDYATSTMQIKKGMNRIKMVATKDSSVEFDFSIPCGSFKETN